MFELQLCYFLHGFFSIVVHYTVVFHRKRLHLVRVDVLTLFVWFCHLRTLSILFSYFGVWYHVTRPDVDVVLSIVSDSGGDKVFI